MDGAAQILLIIYGQTTQMDTRGSEFLAFSSQP